MIIITIAIIIQTIINTDTKKGVGRMSLGCSEKLQKTGGGRMSLGCFQNIPKKVGVACP
jgi:hypothetical protein